MPTVINTNLASLYAQNNLSGAQNNLAQSVMRLSSGLRINSAKDDAAGLAISQNMQTQINGINQSIRNLSDATNMLNVADSSLATIQDMLLRMKQLATNGYNGSMSSSQRADLVDEIQTLNTEINLTSERTKYNANALLTQSTVYSAATLAKGSTTGADSNDTPGLATSKLTVNDYVINGAKAGTYTLTDMGAGVLRLTGGGKQQDLTMTNLAVGSSHRILDFANLGIKIDITATGTTASLAADIAGTFHSKTITVTGSTATFTFQSGPDQTNYIDISAINTQTNNLGVNNEMTNLGSLVTTGNLGTYKTNARAGVAVTSDNWAAAFNSLVNYTDVALEWISEERSAFGAQANQISYMTTNLQSQSTNLQKSKSDIMDTDFAAETARLTKGQIMQQAATAMLAQANQMPNVVLSLLK
jgi:flagellin